MKTRLNTLFDSFSVELKELVGAAIGGGKRGGGGKGKGGMSSGEEGGQQIGGGQRNH